MEFDQYIYDQKIKERDEARAELAKKNKGAAALAEDQAHELSAEEELVNGPAVQLMVQHTEEIPVSLNHGVFFFLKMARRNM